MLRAHALRDERPRVADRGRVEQRTETGRRAADLAIHTDRVRDPRVRPDAFDREHPIAVDTHAVGGRVALSASLDEAEWKVGEAGLGVLEVIDVG